MIAWVEKAISSLILGVGLATICGAEEVPLPEIPPLDAKLTGYEYPFEVKFRNFEDQGQALTMAYMDLAPKKPNGKTVVLFHGKNFSGAYWEKTAKDLSSEGYRVIMPDQIGFGKSSKPTSYQYSFHALAGHTRALLDELKVGQAALVGHSMGGMVAVRFALMFPNRSGKLVLVNPIGLEDWKRKVPYQTIDKATAAELKKGPDDVKDYMRKAYFDGQWKPAYDSLLTIQAGWTIGPDREQMAKVAALTSDMVMTQPVLYEFPDLKVPTLLIIGERDRTAIGRNLVSEEVAKTMGQYQELGKAAAKAIPGARLLAMPGIGHCPQVEVYDDYFRGLSGFLSDESL
jgi:pimeloyl-ACP methyl ester carboxylesterase